MRSHLSITARTSIHGILDLQKRYSPSAHSEARDGLMLSAIVEGRNATVFSPCYYY